MKTRKKLNLRFLSCLLVAAAVLGVGVHLVHGFQVKRNAATLLDLADQAKEEAAKAHQEAEQARAKNDATHEKVARAQEDKFLDKERDYLMRYLGIVPKDRETLVRYAESLDEKAKKIGSGAIRREAFTKLENALRNDPGRDDIRKRQVRAAMDFRMFDIALAHLDVLLKAAPKDVALLRDKGFCLAAMKKNGEAREAYEEAIKVYKNNLEANRANELDPEQVGQHLGDYWSLALLYRERLNDADKANAKLDEMVKESKKEMDERGKTSFAAFSRAYLLRARFYLQFEGKNPEFVEKAKKDVEEALGKAPMEPEVILAAVEVKQTDGSPKEIENARKLLNKGIDANPSEASLYLSLIALEARDDKPTEALSAARNGLKALYDKSDDDPNKSRLLHALADLLVQNGQLKEAGEILDKLKKNPRVEQALLDYLRARILVRESEWNEAIKMFDELTPKLSRLPNLQAQALLLLGQCHEQLNNPDLALNAYERALKLDPLSPSAHYRMGALNMARGRTDEALREYRSVVIGSKPAAGIYTVMARALISQYAALPPERRDRSKLDEIKGVLSKAEMQIRDEAKKQNPEAVEIPVEIPIMRAEAILLEDPKNIDAARKIITEAREKSEDKPGEASLRIAEAQLAEAASEGREKAADILAKAADKNPKLAKRADLMLARLNFLVRSQPNAKDNSPASQKADEDLMNFMRKMEEDVKTLTSDPDKARVLSGLAGAYLVRGKNAEAERLWTEVANRQPKNLSVRLVLFDLALMRKSKGDIDTWLEEMRTLEGDARGVYWRYAKASRLVQDAQPAEKEELSPSGRQLLAKARELLKEAGDRRPSWPRIPTLLAGIDELEGNVNAAIDNYKHSLQLGERRPAIVRKAISLMFQQGQNAEAMALVGDLLQSNDNNTLLMAGLGKLAAESLMSKTGRSNEDVVLADKFANNVVSGDSKSYQDHLWFGRYKWLSAKSKADLDKAKESLEKACELGGKVPETWMTLVAFLASTNDDQNNTNKKLALEKIEEAKKKLPADQVPLTLAACYDSLGDQENAEKSYKAALEASPRDTSVLRRVSNYYLRRGALDKAEIHLRSMIALKRDEPADDNAMWARRGLSAVLGASNLQRRFVEGLKLLEENLKQNKDSVPDKHAKALLLATRGSRGKDAIGLFQELAKIGPLPANERFALAQLYLAAGDRKAGIEQMAILLGSPDGKNPVYEATFARILLEDGNIARAKDQLLELKKALRPGSPLILEIEVRLLHAEHKYDEALNKVLEYAGSKDADQVRTATFLEALARTDEAQARKQYLAAAGNLLENHAKAAGTPESWLALAAFAGGQGQIDKALECCKQAQDKKAAEEAVGQVLASVLRQAPTPNDRASQVEQWLESLLGKKPGSATLMLCLADVYDLEGRFDKAEEMYRKTLRIDPDNVFVLNNLAWLLAFKDPSKAPMAREEALAFINRAIDGVGAGPELLDTRGIIYLQMRSLRESLEDLQALVTRSPKANHYFHLARALASVPNTMGEASNAMNEARKNGFDLRLLHPLERKEGERIVNEISEWQEKNKPH